MVYQEEKLKRQLELEQEGVSLGVARYRQRMETANVTDLPPALALMEQSLEPMVKAIKDFVETSKRGGARTQQARKFLGEFPCYYEVAYITAKEVLNHLYMSTNIQTITIKVSNALATHYEYLKLKEQEPHYLRYIEQQLNKRTSNPEYRKTSIMMRKRKIGIKDTEWDNTSKLHTGAKLLDLFIEVTGLVERVKNHTGMWVLQGSEKALEWIHKQHGRCELLEPTFLPMIIKPKPWINPFEGGFIGDFDFKVKLVKTRSKEAQDLLMGHDMPLVYDAVNTLQETSWRINKKLLEVVKECWRLNNQLGNLPDSEELPLPHTPWTDNDEYDYLKENHPEVVRGWKIKATQVYENRIVQSSKRIKVSQQLWLAEKFQDEEEFYYVWTLDWRGRLYTMQSLVTPQADDLGKSLIEFSEGKPLGERGVYWLAVQLANKFGVDKVSFDERVEWVKENEHGILESAKDPLVNRFWAEADEPWGFLASCFEWLGYREEGDTFKSHLPIALDGTCNGLQNFSAMLLDEVGGQATNLVPMEKPQDVYMEVVEEVNRQIERILELPLSDDDEEALNDKKYARMWQGKVDRNLAKRNVMTVPYGVKLFGMKDQLIEELGKREPDYLDLEDDKDPYKACIWLAKQMQEAIGNVVIAAREAMEWLQQTASVISSTGEAITWTTPAGFLVHQHYKKQKSIDISTYWGKSKVRIRTSLNEDTEKLDRNKQRNGISPNFVHSMDASHLMLTVNKAKEAGLKDFAMIHDSYGTHACDTDKLAEILREAFIEQYSQDVLQKFKEEVSGQLEIDPELINEIPELPRKGTLDLEHVRDSLYFFA